MEDRHILIESFTDTQACSKANKLSPRTKQMQAKTRLYFPGFEAISPVYKSVQPVIDVLEDTTFHCARMHINETDKIAVLNFGNAYRPGGGVEDGAMAQEECLCRASNLYVSLTLPYIKRNYYSWNSKNTGNRGTDAIIYSPGVTVFKTDQPVPQMMNEEEWFEVDVLTCAAPYNDTSRKRPFSQEQLKDIFTKRIENIFAVAIANDVDVLVLGAFGCGAFNNPPEIVAQVFKQMIFQKGYGRYFKKILFPIKANDGQGRNNYQVFSEYLITL